MVDSAKSITEIKSKAKDELIANLQEENGIGPVMAEKAATRALKFFRSTGPAEGELDRRAGRTNSFISAGAAILVCFLTFFLGTLNSKKTDRGELEGFAEKLIFREGSEAAAQQREPIKNGIRRAEEKAADGDAKAQEAIDDLKRKGDIGKLIIVLEHEANQKYAKAVDDDFVNSCREIAALAFIRGDIEKAVFRVEMVLSARPNDFAALNLRGWIHDLKSESQAALRCYERILEESKNDMEWQAIAYGNMGLVHQTLNDLDAAVALHQKALAINQELGREDLAAANYGNLGLIHRRRGQLEEAEEKHKLALNLEKKLRRRAGIADESANLGLVYHAMKDFDQAESMHLSALRIYKSLQSKEGTAIQYGNLGLLYESTGELAKAEKMHRDALQLERELGRIDGIAAECGNLGLVYEKQKKLDLAEQMHQAAFDLHSKYGPNQKGMADDNVNLGRIAHLRGDKALAMKHWDTAKKLYQRVGLPNMVKLLNKEIQKLSPN